MVLNIKYPVLTIIFIICCSELIFTQNTIKKLMPPETDGGMPLMKALMNRKTSREFNSKTLPEQVLSNLLWAANGINRTDEKKRTAPSAMNWQEIDIYLVTSEGLFIYDALTNSLVEKSKADIRAITGIQEFVRDAPVNLIYVADYSKMTDKTIQQKDVHAAADAAFISQNVYLFCSSEGLNTGVRGYIDKPALEKAMNLTESQHVIFAQSVGYPK